MSSRMERNGIVVGRWAEVPCLCGPIIFRQTRPEVHKILHRIMEAICGREKVQAYCQTNAYLADMSGITRTVVVLRRQAYRETTERSAGCRASKTRIIAAVFLSLGGNDGCKHMEREKMRQCHDNNVHGLRGSPFRVPPQLPGCDATISRSRAPHAPRALAGRSFAWYTTGQLAAPLFSEFLFFSWACSWYVFSMSRTLRCTAFV